MVVAATGSITSADARSLVPSHPPATSTRPSSSAVADAPSRGAVIVTVTTPPVSASMRSAVPTAPDTLPPPATSTPVLPAIAAAASARGAEQAAGMERRGDRVVDFEGVERTVVVGAARDEHAAVRKRRRGGASARLSQARCRNPLRRARVQHLGRRRRGFDRALVAGHQRGAARDEDAAVGQAHRRVARARQARGIPAVMNPSGLTTSTVATGAPAARPPISSTRPSSSMTGTAPVRGCPRAAPVCHCPVGTDGVAPCSHKPVATTAATTRTGLIARDFIGEPSSDRRRGPAHATAVNFCSST